ncbi:MAG: SDR family oxidoreductase [Cyanobacteria bacterium J06627_28]
MKVVIVTGGSKGIGKAIATRFAKENYHVVIAARSADKLTETATELKAQFPTPIVPIPTDVRDPKQVQDLVAKTIADFGQLDVLVNNAGLYSTGPTEAFTLEDWHQVLDTNLWGYIHSIHAVLPYFVAQQRGAILNICSVAGKVAMPYSSMYTTSKFAIAGLSQALSTELSTKGVQVCAIYPNIIQTDFPDKAVLQGNSADDQAARYQLLEKTLSMPFIEKPEDVANAAWKALTQNESEHLVGSAKLMTTLNALLPRVTRQMIRFAFQGKD